jgi:hypothetical protein
MFFIVEIKSFEPIRRTSTSNPEKMDPEDSFCSWSLTLIASSEFSLVERPIAPKNSNSMGVISTA